MENQWPKVIRSGSVAVKIYQRSRGRQGEYRQHIVTYYLGERRIRKIITGYAAAKKEAERIANRLSHGETQALNHEVPEVGREVVLGKTACQNDS